MRKLRIAALLCLLCLLTAGCSKEENVKNKTITLTYQEKKYEGQYTGLMKNGKPTEGTFSYKKRGDYLTYNGKISASKMSGKGTLKTNLMKTYFNGTACTGIYEGSVSNGKASANGSFHVLSPKSVKNYVYKGKWAANMMNGNGRLDLHGKYGGSLIGNFDNGYFDPSKSDTYRTIGTLIDPGYSVSANAISFIDEYNDLFMTKDKDDLAPYVDSSLKYSQVIKDPNKYGNKIMKFSNLPVLNSNPNEKLFGEPVSLIILGRPSKNLYVYVICLDSQKDALVNSNQTVYGLPIAVTDSIDPSEKAKILILAGCYLQHE